MAITVPGSGSSATTSVTIPTHAVGDMIVIAARGTVAPAAPAAGGTVPTWTTPTNGSGVNNLVGWRIATTIATATNHTSGTWTSAAQMHVLILRRTGSNTLAVGDSPAQGGANNTQTMIYPAFTLTAGKVSNLVIRYGARGTADTEVRTDGAFAASGVWHTEQPATTPTSAVFSKVVTASEGTFTATPAGVNAAYRCGTLEITETAAPVNHTQPVNDTIAGTDAVAKAVTSPKADDIAGADAIDTDHVVPGAFSPDDITGLALWLEADAIGGLSDNDTVTTWQDSSAANVDATNSGAPSYQTNELNGMAVVRLDGTDDYFNIGSPGVFDALTAGTIFIVLKATGNEGTPGERGLWNWNSHGSDTHFPYSDGVIYDGWGSTVRKTTGDPSVSITNTWLIYSVKSSSGNWTSYIDGTQHYTTATNTVGFSPITFNQIQLGKSLGGYFLKGDIAEVVMYDTALVDADRGDVEDYLNDKWFPAGVGHDQPVDDAAAGTDAQTKAVASTKADTLAVTDAIALRVVRATQADVAAGTDASSRRVGKGVADPAAGTDASTRRVTSAKADSAAGTDAQAKQVTRPQADQIAGMDAATRRVTATKADAIAGTDARTATWTAVRSQPDVIAGTDAQARTTTHPQSDPATITDQIARVWTAKLALADGISVTDAVDTSAAGANERNIDDSAAVTDAVSVETETVRTVGDQIVGIDAQAKQFAHPQVDSGAITDATARTWTAKLSLADGITVTDAIDTSTAGALGENVDDSATITDATSISLGSRRTLSDSIIATDARVTQADYVRQLADAVAVTDALARAWVIFETQDDALTVTDATLARIPPARWPPDTDEDWPADTDEDWEAQTDDRWLVSAESNW